MENTTLPGHGVCETVPIIEGTSMLRGSAKGSKRPSIRQVGSTSNEEMPGKCRRVALDGVEAQRTEVQCGWIGVLYSGKVEHCYGLFDACRIQLGHTGCRYAHANAPIFQQKISHMRRGAVGKNEVVIFSCAKAIFPFA
jgi:hypothetical protein